MVCCVYRVVMHRLYTHLKRARRHKNLRRRPNKNHSHFISKNICPISVEWNARKEAKRTSEKKNLFFFSLLCTLTPTHAHIRFEILPIGFTTTTTTTANAHRNMCVMRVGKKDSEKILAPKRNYKKGQMCCDVPVVIQMCI